MDQNEIDPVLTYIAQYKYYSSEVGRTETTVNHLPILLHSKLRLLALRQEFNTLKLKALIRTQQVLKEENPNINFYSLDSEILRETLSLSSIQSSYNDLIDALKDQYKEQPDGKLFFDSALMLAQSDSYKIITDLIGSKPTPPLDDTYTIFKFDNFKSFESISPERYLMLDINKDPEPLDLTVQQAPEPNPQQVENDPNHLGQIEEISSTMSELSTTIDDLSQYTFDDSEFSELTCDTGYETLVDPDVNN